MRGVEGSSPVEAGDAHGQGGNKGHAGGGGEEGVDDGARGGPEFDEQKGQLKEEEKDDNDGNDAQEHTTINHTNVRGEERRGAYRGEEEGG